MGSFNRIGGHAALDFANTLDDRYTGPAPVDLIATYDDLLRFAVESAVLTRAQAASLRRRSGASRTAALGSARELREAIERIFMAAADDRNPPTHDVDMLNRYVQQALARRRLVCGRGRCDWRWDRIETDASAPVWLIAHAAAELLASDDCRRVRHCAVESCRWLFLDTTKNGSRRWCDMAVCGSRVKARAYYRRRTRPA